MSPKAQRKEGMMFVIRRELEEASACRKQIRLFAETFGRRARVSERNLVRAAEVGLDVGWWLNVHFPHLGVEYNQQVRTLWVEYSQRGDALRVEYNQQVHTLWAEYRQQADALSDLVNQRADALWSKYHQQKGALWVEHDKRKALIVWKALRKNSFRKVASTA